MKSACAALTADDLIGVSVDVQEAPGLGDSGQQETSGLWQQTLKPAVSAYWYWWLVPAACVVVRLTVLTASNDRALGLAVVLLAVLIFVQFLLDMVWSGFDSGKDSPRQLITAQTYTAGFRQAAATLIGVPGVVLGLLAVFGKPPFPLALKVGAVALVLSLAISVMLLFFSSLEVPPEKGPLIFLGYLVNLIFWSLGLGLLCITAVLLVE
jgi:hypothetical protein